MSASVQAAAGVAVSGMVVVVLVKGGSLCCFCIVHILSSLRAGMDYSWGIWVSQNLTTERGTSWGPAEGKGEEEKKEREGLRRLSGHSVKDSGSTHSLRPPVQLPPPP